ncbi:ArsR/SmtB family transcription factor [Polymorphum gilvum]|uniref:Bacterial regulatory protein, ArsR family protein n=1 Tax=Polymorphum gilvum (strain LMG 25793 / CGMCC 1.9160 / SL003B-26A1) TaxID=991905 RepID=F2J596_POLGS|nr:metalloregulator ArsR/SmtB family transcription factor [Polymorphum gilvum]ADZ71154.1 Bacterial regulatory protein, ArsR family protein [Polymorphum gilvum SL003B-26A1]
MADPDTDPGQGPGGADIDDLAAVYRALGHPARLRILTELAARSQACCGEIVDVLPLAQSTVSQHLQVLKDAGLLTCDVRGRTCCYRLSETAITRAEGLSADLMQRLASSAGVGCRKGIEGKSMETSE